MQETRFEGLVENILNENRDIAMELAKSTVLSERVVEHIACPSCQKLLSKAK